MMLSSLLTLLLIGQGYSQCFTTSDCTGDAVPAATPNDCCGESSGGVALLSNGICIHCSCKYNLFGLHKDCITFIV